jgi:hypothetical protein
MVADKRDELGTDKPPLPLAAAAAVLWSPNKRGRAGGLSTDISAEKQKGKKIYINK